MMKTPWINDPRSSRFSLETFYGSVSNLPKTLNRPRRTVEDQGDSERCAAYAAAKNGGYIYHQDFSNVWQADTISLIQGQSIDVQGSNPNAAMESQVLPYGYMIGAAGDGPIQFGDSAYLKVAGNFDAVCSALFMAYDPITKKGACVQAFSHWYPEFNKEYVESPLRASDEYHSYLFIDFDVINGKRYLLAHNSYLNLGNGGFQWFSEEVVDFEFSLPNTTLKIPKTLTTEEIALAKDDSFYGSVQRLLLKIWRTLQNTYGVAR